MSQRKSTDRVLGANSHRKTVLATSITLLLGGLAAPSSQAALPSSATLNFTLGTVQVVACTYGTTPPCTKNTYEITDVVGSFFTMDTNGNGVERNEKTPIGSFNGLQIGATQLASGSHTGTINGSENPDIDAPWEFFGNTGMHQTTGKTTIASEVGNVVTLNLPWSVTWNGIADIPMAPTAAVTVTCDTATCSDGSNYTLDGAYHVGGAGFTSVAYTIHMEGAISLPGTPPVTQPDTAATILGNTIAIPVLANDTSGDGFDSTAPLAVSTPPTNGGSASVTVDTTDPRNSTLDYTPKTSTAAYTDTMQYTARSGAGVDSAATDVTVDVQVNVAPVAADDAASTNPVALDNGGGSLTIQVLNNDSDANNPPGLPGGIDATTVSVTKVSGIGNCTANADGSVTYSQTPPSVATTAVCSYTVKDKDTSAAGPLTSNAATITIDVQSIQSDWPAVLPPNTIPLLAFDAGIGQPDQGIMPQKSWFSMQVSATKLIYTPLEAGPDGGFVIGYEQPAKGSHTGKPNGTEQPGATAPWVFFSNTGFELTRNGGLTGNGDGTIEFRNRYVVTWNGIGVINLGGSSEYPQDLGFATITCSDKPCQHDSDFTLEYAAHVEDVAGEPASGFNGVAYELHLEGKVKFLSASAAASEGTITREDRMTAADTTPDPDVDLQCAGGCFDYTITGVTPKSRVSIVLPLAGGIRNNPVWRILDNGTWRDFDTSAGDSVKTAPAVAGASGLQCPPPGDAAYIPLANDSTANVGHTCVELSITDDGLNDLDKTPGTVADPGGLGTAGTPVFEDTRTSDTSGCTIAATPVSPNERADWWLLAGFLGWLGWKSSKRARH
ncbi:MAG TPA: hypothetical protein ENK05_10205 [Gammaproteobacteria bacterium]|nr:hypothetical protein [Gammaproteobacteria bacterium]